MAPTRVLDAMRVLLVVWFVVFTLLLSNLHKPLYYQSSTVIYRLRWKRERSSVEEPTEQIKHGGNNEQALILRIAYRIWRGRGGGGLNFHPPNLFVHLWFIYIRYFICLLWIIVSSHTYTDATCWIYKDTSKGHKGLIVWSKTTFHKRQIKYVETIQSNSLPSKFVWKDRKNWRWKCNLPPTPTPRPL